MNDAVIQDLKQFISGTISQHTAELKHELHTELRTELLNDLRQEIRTEVGNAKREIVATIDDLSAAVADAMETASESTSAQLSDNEARLTKLEQHAA